MKRNRNVNINISIRYTDIEKSDVFGKAYSVVEASKKFEIPLRRLTGLMAASSNRDGIDGLEEIIVAYKRTMNEEIN